jgi:small conductance mechanosensitive channel
MAIPSQALQPAQMMEPLRALDQVRATAIDLGMKFGPKLLVAIVILVAGFIVGRWAANSIGRMLERSTSLDVPVRRLIERAIRIFVLALFGIVALDNLGVDLLPLIAGLGVAGAGIALAMQGVLANLAAGLTILFTRPFRVGDYISIAKEEGEVLDIQLFSTTLGHADLSRVVIPNRKIAGEILHNYGRLRQLDVAVGVSYQTDVGAALGIVREVLQASPHALKEPTPMVAVARLADSSVCIGVRPWVSAPDYVVATGDINRAVLEAFRNRGIVIPMPRREVRMLEAIA